MEYCVHAGELETDMSVQWLGKLSECQRPCLTPLVCSALQEPYMHQTYMFG